MEYNEKLENTQIMELASAFARYIPVLAGTAGMKSTKFLTGTVKSVDESNRTCKVEGILDSEAITYNEVNLSMERNDGFIKIPAVDSTVFVARMPDGETYVIECSDIDKIICVIDGSNKFVFDATAFVFNGGTFGGMAKTGILETKLNNLENGYNDLVTKFNAHVHVLALSAGTGTAASTAAPETTVLIPTTQAEISDNKIKH